MKFSKNFIRANEKLCDFEHFVPAPYFRKSFMLPFKPKKAEITICGLGFYELYINGKNITKGPLAPYISNTDDLCYYDRYDISHYLEFGENVIGILLGNGFRNPYGGFIWNFEKSPHRGPVTFALALEVSDGDEKFEIEADESFKTHSSPIVYNDLRMGYCYDSNLELEGWNDRGFDDSEWDFAQRERCPKGKAKLCGVEPIVITKERKAVDINYYDELPFAYKSTAKNAEPIKSTMRKNVYVYDFGVNSAGVSKLKINGNPGQKIVIRHGEHTVNGRFCVNTTAFLGRTDQIDERYLNYAQVDTFICKGGEETFVPKFKYDGFRYAYIEGLTPEQATDDAVVFLEMNSDLKSRAEFECSDDILNKLWECTRRSDLSNFYYFPTDCPHREKNGWTGDVSASCEHMLLNLTAENSLKEWMVSIRTAQTSEGALPGIVPTGGWGIEWGNGPFWDAVCVYIPYYVYKYTGDKEVIEDNVSMIMRYLYYVYSQRNENGLIAIGLGDWVSPEHSNNDKILSPLEVTDSITVYDIARKAELLFGLTGRIFESEYAHNIADAMRKSIRENLIDKASMTVSGECQTSQAYALWAGIFNEDEKEKAQQKLVEIIHNDGDINTCGVIGLRYIFHVLSDIGESELAYKIITGNHKNCYGYWVENGATTLWESFLDINGEVNSRNHHFLGDISSWFVQSIAGLKLNPDADDVSHFVIKPNFIKALSFARATYNSFYGQISVQWKRIGGEIEIDIFIPKGMYGEVIINGEEKIVKAGKNKFMVHFADDFYK